MLLNDRSLTSRKDEVSNSLNLTNQDFYVLLVDEKTKKKKAIVSLQAVPSPSLAHFDFPSALRHAKQASNTSSLCLPSKYIYSIKLPVV